MITGIILFLGALIGIFVISAFLHKKHSIFYLTSSIIILILGISILPLVPNESRGFYLSQLVQNKRKAKIIYTNDTLIFTEDINSIKDLKIVQDFMQNGNNVNAEGVIISPDDISGCTDKDRKAAQEFLKIYNDYKIIVGDDAPPMWLICGILFNESTSGMFDWTVPLPISDLATDIANYDGESISLENYTVPQTGDGPFQITGGTGRTSDNPSQIDIINANKYNFKDGMGLCINSLMGYEKQNNLKEVCASANSNLAWLAVASSYNQGAPGFYARFPLKETEVLSAYSNTHNDLFVSNDVIMNEYPHLVTLHGKGNKSMAEVCNYLLKRDWNLYTPPNYNAEPSIISIGNSNGIPIIEPSSGHFPYNALVGDGTGVLHNLGNPPNISGGSGSIYSLLGTSVAARNISHFQKATMGYPMGNSSEVIMGTDLLSLHYGISMYVCGKRLEANVLALCGITSNNATTNPTI